jgi:hypothetical protein
MPHPGLWRDITKVTSLLSGFERGRVTICSITSLTRSRRVYFDSFLAGLSKDSNIKVEAISVADAKVISITDYSG